MTFLTDSICILDQRIIIKNSILLHQTKKNKGCVTLVVALPFTIKKQYLKEKEELWKLKYFTIQKI